MSDLEIENEVPEYQCKACLQPLTYIDAWAIISGPWRYPRRLHIEKPFCKKCAAFWVEN